MLHLSLGADAGESLSPHFLEALQITDLSLVISRLHQVIDSFFWLSFYTGAVILQVILSIASGSLMPLGMPAVGAMRCPWRAPTKKARSASYLSLLGFAYRIGV